MVWLLCCGRTNYGHPFSIQLVTRAATCWEKDPSKVGSKIPLLELYKVVFTKDKVREKRREGESLCAVFTPFYLKRVSSKQGYLPLF